MLKQDIGSDTNKLTYVTLNGESISLHNLKTSGAQSYTAVGGVTFNSAYTTGGGDFTVSGPSILADGVTLSVDSTGTTNGNISISVGNTISGTAGNSTESLILNAGTGTINLGAIYGVGTTASSTGLTTVTITNSGAVTFDTINITGALTQTNAATDKTTFGNSVNVGSANLNGTTLAPASSFNVTNKFTLNSGSWEQAITSGTLPGFSAADFSIGSQATFKRFAGGDGLTSTTPYQIVDVYGLQGVGSKGMLGLYYQPNNDIVASGTTKWNKISENNFSGFAPIGVLYIPFTGTFDGKNHVITGLYINRPSENYIGLFGYIDGSSAKISNVGLEAGSITGQNYVGGLACVIGSGITITNSYNTGSVSGGVTVGGLVGYMLNSNTILNSYNTGSISSYGGDVGGLVGSIYGSLNSISKSYSMGVISDSSGSSAVGGLVGSSIDGTVSNSYWDKLTSGIDSSAGGGEGKVTTDMMTSSTFSGWDLVNTWGMIEGKSYPYLKWQFSAEPKVISGIVYDSSGVAKGPGIAIGLLRNGSTITPVTTQTTYHNGFYYYLIPSTGASDNDRYIGYITNGNLVTTSDSVNANIYEGTINFVGSVASYDMVKAGCDGANCNSNMLFSVTGSGSSASDPYLITPTSGTALLSSGTNSDTFTWSSKDSSNKYYKFDDYKWGAAAADKVVLLNTILPQNVYFNDVDLSKQKPAPKDNGEMVAKNIMPYDIFNYPIARVTQLPALVHIVYLEYYDGYLYQYYMPIGDDEELIFARLKKAKTKLLCANHYRFI